MFEAVTDSQEEEVFVQSDASKWQVSISIIYLTPAKHPDWF